MGRNASLEPFEFGYFKSAVPSKPANHIAVTDSGAKLKVFALREIGGSQITRTKSTKSIQNLQHFPP